MTARASASSATSAGDPAGAFAAHGRRAADPRRLSCRSSARSRSSSRAAPTGDGRLRSGREHPPRPHPAQIRPCRRRLAARPPRRRATPRRDPRQRSTMSACSASSSSSCPAARLLVNEIAPRVHNSGHWTEAACAVQFEQHIRAVAGLPLGDADAPQRLRDGKPDRRRGRARRRRCSPSRDLVLHLYGKAEARPGRKMGHFTRLSPLSA